MTRYLAVIAVLAASPCLAQETRTIVKGATDQSVYIRIVDAADGTPETGVTQATSGLDLEYVRNRAAAVDLTESDLAAVDSAHSDGGIKHIGNGVYRVDLPDAAVATGADAVLVTGTVTDMVVIPARIQLSGFDLQDATPAADVTTWNGTAVASPNTAGYPVVTVKDGTGTGEINTASGVVDANATQVLGTALNDGIAFGGIFEDTIAENISMFFGSTANFGSDSAAATTISDVKVSAAAILDDTGTTGVVVAAGTEIEVADADLRSALGMAAADLDTQLDAIVADTNELQTDWVNGGRLDLLIDSIKAATDLLNSAQAEPTGVPAANETPLDKLAYVYMMLRNKITVTSDTKTYFDDGGAAEFKKGLTDDGTTYTEAEAAAP